MKFNYYLKLNAKMLGIYAITQGICFAMWFMAFWRFAEQAWGQVLYTVLLTGFGAIWMYSKAYKVGERDTKSYSENKPYPLKGFVICILTVLVSLVIFALNFTGKPIFTGLFKIWNYNAVYMFLADELWIKSLAYILIFAVPVLSVFLGYLAGMHRYEFGYKFFSRLVYKKK